MKGTQMFSTTEEMFKHLEWCGYEFIGGLLAKNVAYIELKERVELMERTLAWYANRDNYSPNTAHNGFYVISDDGNLAREAFKGR